MTPTVDITVLTFVFATQTGRKAWFTAEEMNQWRAERKMAPWYKRIYRMLFSQ